MASSLTFSRNLLKGTALANLSHRCLSDCKQIKMDKVLVVSKCTRFAYERHKHKNLSDVEFEHELRQGGVGFETLKHYHKVHHEFEKRFVEILRKMGCEIRITNRFKYTIEDAEWADVVMPIGGDGTYLLAASRIMNNKLPVIGFNSDTTRSHGHLCLPDEYSENPEDSLNLIKQGRFNWLFRNRIRISIVSKDQIVCKSLHDIDLCQDEKMKLMNEKAKNLTPLDLPLLALNEVFIGERYAARVANIKLRFDGSSTEAYVKCSGICVSTGTGSTSWHMSINRLSLQDASDLLKLMNIKAEDDNALASLLSKVFNENLIFPPDDPRMAFSLRDKIVSKIWPQPHGTKTRGFASIMELKSSCFDGCLVIDGSVEFEFNDGSLAILRIFPEDALRTVSLNTKTPADYLDVE